jgi:hypothetical protein
LLLWVGLGGLLVALSLFLLPGPRRPASGRSPGPRARTPLSEADLPLVARAVARTVAGQVAGVPPAGRGRLGEPAEAVYVALRAGGVRRGVAWATAGTAWEALLEASRLARREAGQRAQGVDTAEICVGRGLRDVPFAARRTELAEMHRGVRGLELALGDRVERLSPTDMLARNLDFSAALTRFAPQVAARERQRGEGIIEVRVFDCDQLLVQLGAAPRAVVTMRGNELVELTAVSRRRVAESAELAAEWLVRHVDAAGRMTYKYWPSRGEESTANNMVRQWMATVALVTLARQRPALVPVAERNIRHNLARYYRQEGELGVIDWQGSVKLGAVALAALALYQHPGGGYAAERDALLRTVEHLWNPDGSFRTFLRPAGRNDNQNFYPGEALLLWATLYRDRPDPALLRRIQASIRHYRDWHRVQRNPAFVPWHTRAYATLWQRTRDPALAALVFEMNDWLLPLQQWDSAPYPDMRGRFYDPKRHHFGPPHASSTGVYLEGLIDAHALARAVGDRDRADAYRRAIGRGLRSVLQLQMVDEVDLFYVHQRDRLRGGIRTTEYDNTVRVDNVQHNLMAMLAILEAFTEHDFPACLDRTC